MNSLSQDSSVTSSEESRIKRDITSITLDKNTLIDSSCIDSVCSPYKYDCGTMSSCKDTKLIKTFPWIADFLKLCQAEIGLTRIHSLENLMTEYLRHISAAALQCHLKPNRSAKLKESLKRTLTLFHLFYSDIKKLLEHSVYLEKMSDLIAIYIDMEITALRRSKESLFKIASKLTSSLFIFLDRSQDHILDAIFKTKYMNKKNWELYNLIFTRVLRESPGRAVYDLTYVRYVLAFKMWKRIVKGIDEKRNIVKLACMKLHPPPNFKESVKAAPLSDILPRISRSRNDVTMFLMQAKFCVKDKIKVFLKQINSTEKRGTLSSYFSNFDRIQFSTNNDTDDSRVSSEEDQEENNGGSTALINNIWSSMSGDSGVARQIRMAKILKRKKQKNKKTKCKGAIKPVFKTSNTQTCDSVEEMKKKRLQKMSAVKPLPTSLLKGKPPNQTNISVVRPRIEPPPESALQVSSIESCQSLSTVSVMVDSVDTEMCVDPAKNIEQVNKVDSVCPIDKSDKFINDNTSKLKSEMACSALVWRDRGRTPCESVVKTIERLVPKQAFQGKEDCNQYQRADQEITAAKCLINFSQSSQTPQDPKEEFIKKTVERIQESGRSFHKSQIKPTKACAGQHQELNTKSELEAVQEKCKGMLHDETLRKDFMIFTSQHMFRSNLLNSSLPPETSVPSPYTNARSEETSKRCNCLQCTANQTALITNYKTLTQYLENKRISAGGSASDKIQDPEPASCLPFKKRKTVSVGKEEDEQDGKAVSSGTRDDDVSYPNTPMISIAMIDPKVQSLASGATSLFPPAIDYSVSSTSLNYDDQPSLFVVSSVEQLVPSDSVSSVGEHSSYDTQAFPASEFQIAFKTPAQLENGSVAVTAEEYPVTQILNCSNGIKVKTKSHSHSRSASKKKSKPNVKVDRELRKRK